MEFRGLNGKQKTPGNTDFSAQNPTFEGDFERKTA
jgi:hypothetical protein